MKVKSAININAEQGVLQDSKKIQGKIINVEKLYFCVYLRKSDLHWNDLILHHQIDLFGLDMEKLTMEAIEIRIAFVDSFLNKHLLTTSEYL